MVPLINCSTVFLLLSLGVSPRTVGLPRRKEGASETPHLCRGPHRSEPEPVVPPDPIVRGTGRVGCELGQRRGVDPRLFGVL